MFAAFPGSSVPRFITRSVPTDRIRARRPSLRALERDGSVEDMARSHEEIIRLLKRLPDSSLKELKTLAEKLGGSRTGKPLSALAGTISEEDARDMTQAIGEAFEQVDRGQW